MDSRDAFDLNCAMDDVRSTVYSLKYEDCEAMSPVEVVSACKVKVQDEDVSRLENDVEQVRIILKALRFFESFSSLKNICNYFLTIVKKYPGIRTEIRKDRLRKRYTNDPCGSLFESQDIFSHLSKNNCICFSEKCLPYQKKVSGKREGG